MVAADKQREPEIWSTHYSFFNLDLRKLQAPERELTFSTSTCCSQGAANCQFAFASSSALWVVTPAEVEQWLWLGGCPLSLNGGVKRQIDLPHFTWAMHAHGEGRAAASGHEDCSKRERRENKRSAGMTCHLKQRTCEVPTADGMLVAGLQNRTVYTD
jgi:hypothetical protein